MNDLNGNTRIALVIPSLQPGGMERVMSELARYFCEHSNLEVHLILYGIKRDIFYEVPNSIIIHKPNFPFNNAKRTWSTLKTLLWLRNQLKCIKPKSILSFGEQWNNFVLLATLRLKYPVYVSDRCQPDKSLGKLHDRLRKFLYPKAAGIVCQTQTAQSIYSKMFSHQNFQVIGNPIKEIKTNPEIKKENIVLSVGRLIQSKHHDELIKIFSKIKFEDWKLVIVGDDALKQQNKKVLQGLIEDLGMKEHIILAGKQKDVDSYYNRSKIFAFTSSSEGFPNVVGEAMTAGLPVVAYDCVAGPKDLIDHKETGYLIPLYDANLFAHQLKALMQDELLRDCMSQKAIKKIKQFHLTRIGEKFKRLLLDESIAD